VQILKRDDYLKKSVALFDIKGGVKMEMSKIEWLAALEPYHQASIRGLLIEVKMPDYYDLYDALEQAIRVFMGRYCLARPLLSWDWDLGENRFEPIYLVHVWSDDYNLMDMQDFDYYYTASDLQAILQFIRALVAELKVVVTDIEGVRIIPDIPEDDT
jgi:hypothetical protein